MNKLGYQKFGLSTVVAGGGLSTEFEGSGYVVRFSLRFERDFYE